MVSTGPRTEVITTVLVNEKGEVADWPHHRRRMDEHARRLRLTLPQEDPDVAPPGGTGWRLARVGYDGTAWTVAVRQLGVRDEDVDAVSVTAPRWNDRTNGTKHGDWEAYKRAKETAEQAGCDAALLVHEFAIVDADRATPLLLDDDGTVWMAPTGAGGVDGVVAQQLQSMLPDVGLPVVKGRLNERTVARCAELVLVGTGMGVCHVTSLDGTALGDSRALSKACHALLSQHFTEEATWSRPGPNHVGTRDGHR